MKDLRMRMLTISPLLALRSTQLSIAGEPNAGSNIGGLALHRQFKSNRNFYVVDSAPLRTNAP